VKRYDVLISRSERHLKWRALDRLEQFLMALCGISLAGFTTSVMLDIATRSIGHPWLWLQEVTSTFFVYGIFVGAAAATRRNDHLHLTAVAEELSRCLLNLARQASKNKTYAAKLLRATA
jgi:TRAP-type C4-dicarboxylate transport system permease small subunit